MLRPTRILTVCAAALCCTLALSSRTREAAAFPKPSVFPNSWQLKFEHSAPKRIVVRSPGAINPAGGQTVVTGSDATVWPAAVLRGDYGRIEIGAPDHRWLIFPAEISRPASASARRSSVDRQIPRWAATIRRFHSMLVHPFLNPAAARSAALRYSSSTVSEET